MWWPCTMYISKVIVSKDSAMLCNTGWHGWSLLHDDETENPFHHGLDSIENRTKFQKETPTTPKTEPNSKRKRQQHRSQHLRIWKKNRQNTSKHHGNSERSIFTTKPWSKATNNISSSCWFTTCHHPHWHQPTQTQVTSENKPSPHST